MNPHTDRIFIDINVYLRRVNKDFHTYAYANHSYHIAHASRRRGF